MRRRTVTGFPSRLRVMVGRVSGREVWGGAVCAAGAGAIVGAEGLPGRTRPRSGCGPRAGGRACETRARALRVRGAPRLGQPVDHVMLIALPRTKGLDGSVIWFDDHRPEMARAALERATGLETLTALAGREARRRRSAVRGGGCAAVPRGPAGASPSRRREEPAAARRRRSLGSAGDGAPWAKPDTIGRQYAGTVLSVVGGEPRLRGRGRRVAGTTASR